MTRRRRPAVFRPSSRLVRPEKARHRGADARRCEHCAAESVMAEVRWGKKRSGGMSLMPFRLSRRVLLGAAPLLAVPLGGGPAAAAEGDFNAFLAGVRRDAAAQGIRPGTIDVAFRNVQFLPRVV